MSARIQEIQNIIASTPTSVSTAWMSWLSDCCMVWARLSMSLVTRREHLALGLLVEVRQRQAAQLVLDPLTQPVDGPLDHPGGQPALDVAEQRRAGVQREHAEQHHAPARGSRCPARRSRSSSRPGPPASAAPWPGAPGLPGRCPRRQAGRGRWAAPRRASCRPRPRR